MHCNADVGFLDRDTIEPKPTVARGGASLLLTDDEDAASGPGVAMQDPGEASTTGGVLRRSIVHISCQHFAGKLCCGGLCAFPTLNLGLEVLRLGHSSSTVRKGVRRLSREAGLDDLRDSLEKNSQ